MPDNSTKSPLRTYGCGDLDVVFGDADIALCPWERAGRLKTGDPILESNTAEVLAAPGPTFATLHVRPGLKPHLDYALVHGEAARKRFEAGLADELSRLKAKA